METTSLCLNTRLLVKKNFQILILFIEINVNVCLLCDHHLMKGIIINTRRPTCKLKVSYALGFSVSADFFFAFWGAGMLVIHIVPFRTSRNALKNFRCLDISNRLRNWNKVKKPLREVKIAIMPIGITNIHKQINVSEFINKLSFICVLWI